jgi:hypothetical protein
MVKPEYNQKDQDEAYEASRKSIQQRNQYVTLSDYQKRQLLKFAELKKKDKSTKEPENNNDIDSILNNIKNNFDIKLYYLYINNKIICKEKTIPKIKSSLKESYNKPVYDVKGYLISFSVDKKYKYPLMVNCSSYTINPKLSLLSFDDDASQTFTYTNTELKKYGFNENHLFKIMKALKDETVSLGSNTIPISEVLKSTSKSTKDIKNLIVVVLSYGPMGGGTTPHANVVVFGRAPHRFL